MTDAPIAIVNLTRSAILADAARYARGPWRRCIGLLGRASLPPGEGLVFAPGTGIHTWFMRFPIDLLYVRADERGGRVGTVVRLRAGLRPFRVAPGRADLIVELPAGTIARTATALDDRIALGPAADGRE